MTTEPMRRRSLLPIQPHQPHEVSDAEVALVARQNGFEVVPVPTPSEDSAATPRRNRQRTGRDHPFSVRLKQQTLDFIYGQANGRNIPVAEVIEEMAEALQRQQQGRG